MKHEGPDKTEEKGAIKHSDPFASALSKIATSSAASSRAAIEASKATKPSRSYSISSMPHAKDRA